MTAEGLAIRGVALRAEHGRAVRPVVGVRPLLVLGTLTIISALHALLYLPYVVDDVYISLVYVRQLASGNGLTYNGGLQVEGYSNLLWVLSLTPIAWFGGDLLVGAKVIGVLISAATVGLTYALARTVVSGWWTYAAAVLLTASPTFALWSSSGMETALFTALVTVSVYLFVIGKRRRVAFLASGPVFALTALTRPEGGLFFLVALAVCAAEALRQRDSSAVPRVGLWLGLFAAITVSHLIWRWTYYGFPLPNTAYVKAGGSLARQSLRGAQYVYQFAAANANVLLVAVPLAAVTRFSRAERVLAAIVAAYVAFVVLAGGDWMPLHRFLAPVLPVALVLFVASLRLLANGYWLGARLSLSLMAAITILAAVTTVDGLYINKSIPIALGSGRLTLGDRPAWVQWLESHGSPGDVVAVVDAGAVAYYTPLTVLDMWGLLDVHIAHLPAAAPSRLLEPAFRYGFGKWDPEYVLAARPKYVQMQVSRRAVEAGDLTTTWIGSDLLLRHPRFLDEYAVVDAPGVEGLFARRS